AAIFAAYMVCSSSSSSRESDQPPETIVTSIVLPQIFLRNILPHSKPSLIIRKLSNTSEPVETLGRPAFSALKRLPDLQLPQSYASSAPYSAISSRLNGNNAVYPSQQTPTTGFAGQPNIGLKTPSPSPTSLNGAAPSNGLLEDSVDHPGYSNPDPNVQHYQPAHESYSNNMNQHQQYMDSQQSHMPVGQSYTSQASGAGSMPQYPTYQQQPPVMHPGPNSYAPSPSAYGQYNGYNGVTSPHSAQQASSSMGSQMLPLPTMPSSGHPQHPYGGPAGAAQPFPPPQPHDTTGQQAPPGMKPRVTATLWEDEGSMCFQVEAKGVCVARRDDNHMINGTKLLNVAGMTRGRRDGILKSEKTRHVVKIGPMHLKGVWIPFDRALDFANREKITESLYPLFVHNIGALLYHPTNHSRTTAVLSAHEKQKLDKTRGGQGSMIGASGSQAPALHHHHSMASSHVSQSPHQIAPHPGTGRPSLDRAHTFPTPPTSASSGIGMSNQSNDYTWGAPNLAGGAQGSQSMVEPHAHSTPNTPATTPPGHAMSNLHSYQAQQPYDAAKSMYSGSASQQGPYAPSSITRYAPVQSSTYMKHEMGPPISRITDLDEHETKQEPYSHGPTNPAVGHGTGEEEADHEHDTDYSHDNNNAYNANRSAYNYSSGTGLASLQGEHPHISPEVTGSPSHPNGSGRVTPRNSSGGPAQWTAGHQTPPRATYSSNAYNPISDARGSIPNGTSGVETYGTSSMQAAYAPAHMNGATPSNKRMREDEDADYGSRPASRGDDIDGLKRRKMGAESMSGGSYERDNRPMIRNPSRPVARARR
ncbi:MAG: hypothetical protein Q9186_004962, partial [Xanthomendoza sp. 1 TL-2023]